MMPTSSTTELPLYFVLLCDLDENSLGIGFVLFLVLRPGLIFSSFGNLVMEIFGFLVVMVDPVLPMTSVELFATREDFNFDRVFFPKFFTVKLHL